MSTKNIILIIIIFGALISGSGVLLLQFGSSNKDLGGTDTLTITTASTIGESRIASASSSEVVARNSARQFIEICRTDADGSDTSTVFYLAVNASASKERGIVLNSVRPCVSFTDPMVTGNFEAIASISASTDYASLSYTEF